MFGLTTLGIIHTAISLVAVGSGLSALVRDKEISCRTATGKVYVITTILTCLTGFGIFQHGGFGKPHALGIITLVVVGIAAAAGRSRLFGRLSPYVETISYTTTFLFHLIPGFTETLTRLPVGQPYASGPDDPKLQPFIGVSFLAYLIVAALQVWKLRGSAKG